MQSAEAGFGKYAVQFAKQWGAWSIFFFQAEDGIRDYKVTGVQTCALPLVRVPAQRGDATRCENRMPDPSANPYLALAVQLATGLDGIQERIDPGAPVNKNIVRTSYRERRKIRIDDLTRDPHEAIDHLQQ